MTDERTSWPLATLRDGRLLWHISGTNPPRYAVDEKLEQLWREGQRRMGTTEIYCHACGAPIAQPKTGRRRKYCSDECRREADKANRKRAPRQLFCGICGYAIIRSAQTGRRPKYCGFC